jgi:CheY-like chemotaxis protein
MESQQSVTPQILVVDDDPINNRILNQMLLKLGYRPDVAASGEQALQLLREKHYDLVFMDFQMPGMSGCMATTLLRSPASQAINSTVPVIALTADCTDDAKTACIAAGMNDFLTKPIKYDQLSATLSCWL